MRNVVAISLPKQLDEQMTGFIAFFRGSNPLSQRVRPSENYFQKNREKSMINNLAIFEKIVRRLGLRGIFAEIRWRASRQERFFAITKI